MELQKEQPKEEYIILVPIGKQKQYSLEEFFNNIIKYQSKPKEIVVCVGLETLVEQFRKNIESAGIDFKVLLYKNEADVEKEKGTLECIKDSREILRKYFLDSSYQWALWLDSDVFPEFDCFKSLYEAATKNKAIVVNSGYMGETDNIWHASGLMLTHKIACYASRFIIGKVPRENELINLSEDLMFFSIIDAVGTRSFIKLWTGWDGRIIDNFGPVKHIINAGEEKWLKVPIKKEIGIYKKIGDI